MPRGQKVSRLLATSSKFLVANAQFLVALATSQSQCRTLTRIGSFTPNMLPILKDEKTNLIININAVTITFKKVVNLFCVMIEKGPM